jgi:hypothetical protein
VSEAQVVAAAGLASALYLRVLALGLRLCALLALLTWALVLPVNLSGEKHLVCTAASVCVWGRLLAPPAGCVKQVDGMHNQQAILLAAPASQPAPVAMALLRKARSCTC